MVKLSERTLGTIRWAAPIIWGAGVIFCVWKQDHPPQILGFVAIASYFGIKHARSSWLYGYGSWMAVLWLAAGFASLIFTFARVYVLTGILDSERVASHECGPCIYLSIVTWTTLGYGDYVPSVAARPYAAMEALAGYVYMALTIGIIVQAMVEIRKR